MNRRKSAALIALTVVLGVGACGNSKTGADAAAGAGGGGSHGGAGGSNGGAGGSSGGAGGSSAGTGGQAGGGGGQQDAGSCRMYGQSCGASQPCCAPMICAGGCTMPVSQDASSWSDTTVDAAVDAQDAGIDPDPFQCSTVTPLLLSDPVVISGTVSGGQTLTVQITMTDTDPSGYVSYPGVVLTSSTPGVSFAAAEAGPPGSSVEGAASKPITFSVKLDASIPPGTEVQITARAYGWGHPAPDCNGFVLSFSLTTI
jgi:hypothetical protein